MNEMRIKAEHKVFSTYPITKFQSIIDKNKVFIEADNGVVNLHIVSRKGKEKLQHFGLKIFEMLFLYIGSFPKIRDIYYNGEPQDISKLANKYTSYSYFERVDLLVCSINENTINDGKFQIFKQLPSIPIASFEYLLSEAYKSINITHKITLLTHVIEGVTTDKSYRERVQEISKAFFILHRKCNCEILSLLKKNKAKFIDLFVDTRHWYSHFLKVEQRKGRVKTGTEMVIYFEILCFCIRLFLLNEMQIPLFQDTISEYLYSLHDWILEVKYERNEPLKSKTYKIRKGMKEFQKFLDELIMNSTEEVSSNGNA